MVWCSYNYDFDSAVGEHVVTTEKPSKVRLASFTSENATIKCGNTAAVDSKAAAADKEEDEDSHSAVFKTMRWFTVEPSLVLCYMIHASNFSLITQYIYYAIGEKYNLTAIMAGEGGNMSLGDPTPGCGNMENDKNSTAYIMQQRAQAEAARFNLYVDMITDIPGFIVILFFGRLMDQVGRKPMLILPLVGLSLRAILYILQQLLNLPLEVILLSGVMESVTGGFSTYMTAAYTVMIDTIGTRERARRIAIVDISYIFGMALMSFTMGVMIQQLGFFWPFVVVLVGHLINLVYIIFFVPETATRTAGCASVSPWFIVDCFKVIIKKREKGKRKRVFISVIVWLLLGFGAAVYTLDSLYKLNSPFCWSAQMLGTFAAISSLIPALIQMLFAAFMLKKVNDVNVILASLLSMMGAAIITAFATTDLMLWIAPLVGCMGGLNLPVLRSVISKLLPSNEQGSVFAFMQSMTKLTGVAASTLYSNVYAATLYSFKGTVYLIQAGFMVLCFVLLIIFKIMTRKQNQTDAYEGKDSVISKEDKTTSKF